MSQHRHKVFVSFYDEDRRYRRKFVEMMGDSIVDKSVGYGDIDDTVSIDTILRNIREDFISDATVTVVLIGPCTWQRKYVDWEIGSSLRHTVMNPRCGLLGILLPNHLDHGKRTRNPHRIPPRLADNLRGTDPFASIYDWSGRPSVIQSWVHEAFNKRKIIFPDNGRRLFGRNRSGNCSNGWSD